MTDLLCQTESSIQEFNATIVAVDEANTREAGHIHVVDYQSKGKLNKRLSIAVEA